jgi:hypothetical protein
MEGKSEYAIIAGDINNFVNDLKKMEAENIIIAKHISTQMVEIKNPDYMQGITLNAPQKITTVFVSAFIEFKKKEVVKPIVN